MTLYLPNHSDLACLPSFLLPLINLILENKLSLSWASLRGSQAGGGVGRAVLKLCMLGRWREAGRVKGTLAWQKEEAGCRSGFLSFPHSLHHKPVSFLVQPFQRVSCSPVSCSPVCVLLHPSQRTKLVPSIQVCIFGSLVGGKGSS